MIGVRLLFIDWAAISAQVGGRNIISDVCRSYVNHGSNQRAGLQVLRVREKGRHLWPAGDRNSVGQFVATDGSRPGGPPSSAMDTAAGVVAKLAGLRLTTFCRCTSLGACLRRSTCPAY